MAKNHFTDYFFLSYDAMRRKFSESKLFLLFSELFENTEINKFILSIDFTIIRQLK